MKVDWFEIVVMGFIGFVFLGLVVLIVLGLTGVIQFTHDPNYHPDPVLICNKIGNMQICNSF